MTPERWAQVKQVMQAALDVPEAERGAWLENASGGDAALRREVESLLTAHRNASGFLDGPAPLPEPPASPSLQPGTRIGPYRIVQSIGEGGMGTVYQALREDIGKLVALKVVKGGIESEFLLSRFANERRSWRTSSIPTSRKFLDTGLTGGGHPYFVMEFVDGEPIDVHCDAHRLDTRRRLELFLKVCAGVEYAHHHLVVHRDLKPRNILVTPEGDPKLLDFGIAKILEEDPLTGAPHAHRDRHAHDDAGVRQSGAGARRARQHVRATCIRWACCSTNCSPATRPTASGDGRRTRRRKPSARRSRRCPAPWCGAPSRPIRTAARRR